MGMSALMSPAPKEIEEDPAALDGLVKIVRLYGPPKAQRRRHQHRHRQDRPTGPAKRTGQDDEHPENPTRRQYAAKKTAAETAKHIYRGECAYCHGPDGAGDGPTAVTLKVKPRSFRSVGWQDHVTDDRIKTAIVSGGAAVGLKS